MKITKPVDAPKTPCQKTGHSFTLIDNTERREVVGKDTHVRRSFICTQCGDVVSPVVVVWKDFIPEGRNSR